MLRIERDPAFWTAIAAHPALERLRHGLDPAVFGALAARPEMLPLAAEHGGFLFSALDGFGFARELHTLFTPEGWGREALTAGIEALGVIFAGPCQALLTYEVADNPRSRPPRTFGFVLAGDWRETGVGTLRLWVLTREMWIESPARMRRNRCLS